MRETAHAFRRRDVLRLLLAAIVYFALTPFEAEAQDSTLHLDPQRTTINFTLGDVLHTVHGTFHLKGGTLRLAAAASKLSGEIVVDARSGESGNGMRDRKMHKEVLESDRYPDITFRPDRVEGDVVSQGKSSVRVHGIFTIHGSDHELTVPAEVQMAPGYWTATLHFAVPYAKWGMKNPSTMFLRVSESVDIDLTTSGITSTP
ncbi:MAG: YceI family protein [Candidatus Sulfotelmatobacter sp.]